MLEYALAISVLLLSITFSAVFATVTAFLLSYLPSAKRWAERRLEGDVAPADQLTAFSMPDSVREYIEMESEEWAREELRQEALQLHKLLEGDWERVERELRKRHGRYDMDPEQAADIAWAGSAARVEAFPGQDDGAHDVFTQQGL